MGVDIEGFSRLVGEIYDASLGAGSWEVPLAELTTLLDVTGCVLTIRSGNDRSLLSATVRGEPQEYYLDHFRNIDYITEAAERSAAGSVQPLADLAELQPRSEFRSDFVKRFDMGTGLIGRVSLGDPAICLVAPTSVTATNFASDDRIRLMALAGGHFRRALRMRADIMAAHGAVVGMIDTSRHAVFVVGGAGEVLHANMAATVLMTGGDGLTVRGSLVATHRPTDLLLRTVVGHALTPTVGGVREGGSVVVPRPSGKRSFVVHVTPLGASTVESSAMTAQITVIDPERIDDPPTHLLRKVFGLTAAEAQVAVRVLDGEGLRPIAEALSVSLATVKTHLQHIFDKTGTHRQAELVRLLVTVGISR